MPNTHQTVGANEKYHAVLSVTADQMSEEHMVGLHLRGYMIYGYMSTRMH